MRKEKLSPLKKAFVIGGLSATAVGIGYSAERASNDQELSGMAEMVQFAGYIGLAATGLKSLNHLAGKQVLRMREQEENERRILMASLPKLQEGLSPHIVARKLSLRDDVDTSSLHLDLYMTVGSANRGHLDDGKWAYQCLREDIDRTVNNLANVYNSEVHTATGDADFEALRLSLFLDEVLPIADDCSITPQTEDTGKYWFDYIQRQAFARADMISQNA